MHLLWVPLCLFSSTILCIYCQVCIVQFILIPQAFPVRSVSVSSCVRFTVFFFSSINSFTVPRWAPAISVAPSLFLTPRFSYSFNGTFPCTLLYTFLVHSTYLFFRVQLFVFCSTFCFSRLSPVRSDIRIPVFFPGGIPSTFESQMKLNSLLAPCDPISFKISCVSSYSPLVIYV